MRPYDRKHALLHLVGDGVSDDYYTLDIASAVFTQVTFGASLGGIGGVAVDDYTDLTAVFPQRPSASASFVLETAAHGNAGELAGTAVLASNGILLPNPIILGLGVCDAGGFVTGNVPVPAGTLSAGDTLIIASARLDTATGLVLFGTAVDVIFQ